MSLAENGVKIVAPPLWMLVKEDPNSDIGITTSAYVDSAKEHGLGIITWTLERTGPGLNGWYWQSLANSIDNYDKNALANHEIDRVDGMKFELLRVLSEDAGVVGVFSDWPATTTFYANCMGLALRDDNGDADDVTPEVIARNSGSRRVLIAAGRIVNVVLKLAGL